MDFPIGNLNPNDRQRIKGAKMKEKGVYFDILTPMGFLLRSANVFGDKVAVVYLPPFLTSRHNSVKKSLTIIPSLMVYHISNLINHEKLERSLVNWVFYLNLKEKKFSKKLLNSHL